MNQQLWDYVTAARTAGFDDQKIRGDLLAAGWKETDVNEILPNLEATTFVQSALAVDIAQPPSTDSPVLDSKGTFFLKKLKDPKIWGDIIGLLLIIAAGTYFYTVKASGPEAVWNRFNLSDAFPTQDAWYKSVAEINYSETNVDQAVSANVNAEFIAGLQDNKEMAQGTIAVNYKYGGLNTSIDAIEFRLLDKTFYINVENIPFVGEFAKDYDGWIKFDEAKLEKTIGTDSQQEKDIVDQALEILKANKVVDSHKYIAKEDVLGKKTHHFSVTIDREALIKSYEQITKLDKLVAAQITPEETKQITDFLNNLEASVELWLGTDDSKIYRVVVNVKMQGTLAQAQKKSSDAKVFAEMRSLATSLELYYADNGNYPLSLSELSSYTGMPASKTNDVAQCPFKEAYAYLSIDNGKSYSLRTCIVTENSTFSTGILEASPAGLKTIEAHPEWNNISNSDIKAKLNALFTFDLKFAPTAAITVRAPENFWDLSDSLPTLSPGNATGSEILPSGQFER